MKLTPEELQLFKNLGNSELGRDIVAYVRRLQSHICDSRNWVEGDTRESVVKAADILEKELCGKIVTVKKNVNHVINEGE